MKGLTLLEVLIAMGITAIVGSLLMVIIVNSTGLFTKQSSKVTEGLNINDAMLVMRSSIKQASGVADTSSANQLVLEVASIDAAGNIIDNTFDNFVFFADQNFLRFKILPDPQSQRNAADQIFSNSVDSINFKYLNSAVPPAEVAPSNAVKVSISLALETSTATSEANLRND